MRISDWSSDVCSSDLFLVVPDVQKLASLGITLTDLGNALERNNTSVGGGFVNRNGEGLAVRSDALVRNAGELARTVIATRNGVPITVEKVATVDRKSTRLNYRHSRATRWPHFSRKQKKKINTTYTINDKQQ